MLVVDPYEGALWDPRKSLHSSHVVRGVKRILEMKIKADLKKKKVKQKRKKRKNTLNFKDILGVCMGPRLA